MEYFQELEQHFTDPKNINQNDLIVGYESIEKAKATGAKNIEETKIKIVEFKQTELNMQMSIGWEENK